MPSRNLADADPRLVTVFEQVAADYAAANPGWTVVPTCTHRSTAEQAEDFAQGRTRPGRILTNDDGVQALSPHNYQPARAIDYALERAGVIDWNDLARYRDVGHRAVALGMEYGGDWKSFKGDNDHIQLPEAA